MGLGVAVLIILILITAARLARRARCSVHWLHLRRSSAPIPTSEDTCEEPTAGERRPRATALTTTAPVVLACLTTVVACLAAVLAVVTFYSNAGGAVAAEPVSSPTPVWPASTTLLREAVDWSLPLPMPISTPVRPPPPPLLLPRNDILLILTDDQDQMLGGGFHAGDAPDTPTPMPRTRDLVGRAGSIATNFFAHSPICCPSRAQLFTGRCASPDFDAHPACLRWLTAHLPRPSMSADPSLCGSRRCHSQTCTISSLTPPIHQMTPKRIACMSTVDALTTSLSHGR